MIHPARLFALLGVAAIVVAFAATWVTLPGVPCNRRVEPPASLFLHGLTYHLYGVNDCVRLHELKSRIAVVYGSAAVVVVLIGLAFGAGRPVPSRA